MDDEEEVELRLNALAEMRGRDLVAGLIGELRTVRREIVGLKRELDALNGYLEKSDRSLVFGTSELPLPKTVVFDADQRFDPRFGFYPVEYLESGLPFCWTGPAREFSFEVFVDRTAGAELSLEGARFLDHERQRNITLQVDGESVPIVPAPVAKGLRYSAELPATTRRAGARLIFVVPEVLPPPRGTDARLLGLAFTRLAITAHTIVWQNARTGPNAPSANSEPHGESVAPMKRKMRLATAGAEITSGAEKKAHDGTTADDGITAVNGMMAEDGITAGSGTHE
ncbi:MAG TPA: hypothetical protein VHX61_02495 [Rhizomicrobium sp.]|jgi:hypothetical protein|nr:hypothetical protein [Rhizomicrobium sp.]